MPITLFSADGAARLHVFEDDGASRERMRREATTGDTIAICRCPLPHLDGVGGAMRCADLVMSVHFRDTGPELRQGPRFREV